MGMSINFLLWGLYLVVIAHPCLTLNFPAEAIAHPDGLAVLGVLFSLSNRCTITPTPSHLFYHPLYISLALDFPSF